MVAIYRVENDSRFRSSLIQGNYLVNKREFPSARENDVILIFFRKSAISDCKISQKSLRISKLDLKKVREFPNLLWKRLKIVRKQ